MSLSHSADRGQLAHQKFEDSRFTSTVFTNLTVNTTWHHRSDPALLITWHVDYLVKWDRSWRIYLFLLHVTLVPLRDAWSLISRCYWWHVRCRYVTQGQLTGWVQRRVAGLQSNKTPLHLTAGWEETTSQSYLETCGNKTLLCDWWRTWTILTNCCCGRRQHVLNRRGVQVVRWENSCG